MCICSWIIENLGAIGLGLDLIGASLMVGNRFLITRRLGLWLSPVHANRMNSYQTLLEDDNDDSQFDEIGSGDNDGTNPDANDSSDTESDEAKSTTQTETNNDNEDALQEDAAEDSKESSAANEKTKRADFESEDSGSKK